MEGGVVAAARPLLLLARVAGLAPFRLQGPGSRSLRASTSATYYSVGVATVLCAAWLFINFLYCTAVYAKPDIAGIIVEPLTGNLTFLFSVVCVMRNMTVNKRRFARLVNILENVDRFVFSADAAYYKAMRRRILSILACFFVYSTVIHSYILYEWWYTKALNRLLLMGPSVNVSMTFELLFITCVLGMRLHFRNFNEQLKTMIHFQGAHGGIPIDAAGMLTLNQPARALWKPFGRIAGDTAAILATDGQPKQAWRAHKGTKSDVAALLAPAELSKSFELTGRGAAAIVKPDVSTKVAVVAHDGSGSDAEAILRLRRARRAHCDAVRVINSAFGVPLLLDTLHVFCGLISVAYLALNDARDPFLLASLFASYIVKVAVLGVTCQACYQEAERGAALTSHLQLQLPAGPQLAQLALLEQQMRSEPVRFSVCGCFDLNVPFCYSLLAAALTYLLVLMQNR